MPRAQLYERIANDLLDQIRDGKLQPGSQLPSRTELQQRYEVSDTVVGKAMMLVRASGLVETVAGVGVFVAEK